MKQRFLMFALAAGLGMGMYSCQKEASPVEDNSGIPESVMAAIGAAGFSTENVIRDGAGYIVEGDIYIDDNHLRTQPGWFTMNIAQTEQYRTTNLVTGLPRVITVSVNSKLPNEYEGNTGYVAQALARFNAENLSISFQLVSSNGEINLVNANGSYLASAGFPSGGDPYNEVKVNSRSLRGQPAGTIVSVIAHEIGHCIGFRHTDYMDRSYSCGGSTANEGASTVGAVLIPGTPSGPDPNSWMLACIGGGVNRPFNANDKTALNYLY
jgi:hypothetical protein